MCVTESRGYKSERLAILSLVSGRCDPSKASLLSLSLSLSYGLPRSWRKGTTDSVRRLHLVP